MPFFRKQNGGDSSLRTPDDELRCAASQGEVAWVRELMQRGGGKLAPDKEGRTALHLATSNGHIEVVKIFIENGCDFNGQDKLGYSPLQRACIEGHVEIVRVLLEAGADKDKQDNVQGNSALHETAWHGHSVAMELLLQAKANLYLRNKTGSTALHLACQNGHNQCCRLLTQHMAKMDVKDRYDDTPLHTATRYLHAGVSKILLTGGANPNVANKNGDHPLHLACNLGKTKLVKLLVDNAADLSAVNKHGETPFAIAQRKQYGELVSLLQQVQVHQHPNTKMTSRMGKDRRGKIRERLQAYRDGGSNWQLLFQDWMPCGPQQGPSNGLPVCPHLHSLGPSFSSSPTKPLQPLSKGEQYFVDLAGNVHKGPVGTMCACYCAPFFYHLAKQSNDAHLELLDEIDACHHELSHEITDLRHVTERKLANINQTVRFELAARPANRRSPGGGLNGVIAGGKNLAHSKSSMSGKVANQKVAGKSAPRQLLMTAEKTSSPKLNTVDPTFMTFQKRMQDHQLFQYRRQRRNKLIAAAQAQIGVPPNLARSKSESELETDIERERFIKADIGLAQCGSDESLSNLSDDLYMDASLRPYAPGRLNKSMNGTALKGKDSVTIRSGTSKDSTSECNGDEKSLNSSIIQTKFEISARRFNAAAHDADSFQESSCTTPMTWSSHPYTADSSSARNSISSYGSNVSGTQSHMSNTQSFQQSLDSGYGTHPPGNTPSLPSTSAVPSPRTEYAPGPEIYVNGALPRSAPEKWTIATCTPPIVTEESERELAKQIALKFEAETQTDREETSDSHEYTELELKSECSSARCKRPAGGVERHDHVQRAPPILPIPPPPRKPLPPLPRESSAPSKRGNTMHRPSKGRICMTTNV